MSLVWTLVVFVLLLTLVLWVAILTALVFRLHHNLRFVYQILQVSQPPAPEAYPLERDA
jgi:hypothetical protein